MASYPLSLFIFRRDLRLEDNTALNAALRSSDQVIPCFILDPRQASEHPFKSDQALRFMLESLDELRVALQKRGGRLYVFVGKAEEVVTRLLDQGKIKAVFFNRDYTPFSVTRDLAIARSAQKRGIACTSFDDALLNPPDVVRKQDGGPYTVFTPFFKKASMIEIARSSSLAKGVFFVDQVVGEMPGALADSAPQGMSSQIVRGGREEALAILKKAKSFKNYVDTHDIPAEDATTHLSAHLKFGTISARETYHAFRKELGVAHSLIRQLFWRDFFTTIAHHFPHVFGHCFYEEYDAIRWENDERLFQVWCTGKTGVPIVDAGMRELNSTGFMHNRVRMIVASFLIKDLHIDWRWGEKYFARHLVDYDPAVNNGNWQWAASTGCDHQPYFRIFNPWLQHKRFDPDSRYVKTWVSELRSLSSVKILSLESEQPELAGYPEPIIRHTDAILWAKQVYRDVVRRGKKY